LNDGIKEGYPSPPLINSYFTTIGSSSVKTVAALNPYRVMTDRRTDRIPIANTRSQQYMPVQLWRVKIKKKVVKSTHIAKVVTT